jgi:hypothetical protein
MRGIPSGDLRDPGFRRLRYARYADDHLLGFTGPRAEAEQIRDRLAAFLRDELKLELPPEKTLIIHAFDPARATLEIRDGKNHENRLVPVTGRLAATLESYVAAAHPCPEHSHKLFHTGDPSRPADKSTVYNRFRRYLADADIPHFPGGPHIYSLRHGFAVANLRRWAARTWWSCCPTCRPTWATPTCAEPSTTSS